VFETIVERRGPITLGAVMLRLRYLTSIPVLAGVLRSRIAELRASGELPPAPEGASASAQGGWIGPALAIAAAAWLALEFGVAIGLALLVGIVVHEAGHVWSMRRHGHPRPRVYLIPFLGGVAVSGGRFRSDAESAEITLMGPAFGLLPSLVALALHLVTGDPWFAAVAAGLAVVNGFNLAPVPPLDGGHVAQLLLRPLGPRAWFAGSGLLVLLAGAGAAALASTSLLVLAALGAVAWSAVPTPPEEVAPLRAAGLAGTAGAYAGLLALHAAAVAYALDRLGPADWADFMDALASGPFG
jgi:Zn-dependent protease